MPKYNVKLMLQATTAGQKLQLSATLRIQTHRTQRNAAPKRRSTA
jgi:hypothetical protein